MTISEFQTRRGLRPTRRRPASSLRIAAATPAEQARIKAAHGQAESRKISALARNQVFCAIDQDSRLGSMGPIHKLMLKGQPVFLCCKGCEAEAKAHPDETLLKVQNLMTRVAASKRP